MPVVFINQTVLCRFLLSGICLQPDYWPVHGLHIDSLPPSMSVCMKTMSSQKKAPVFISVYVIRPRRSTGNHHHHHHHYHHVQHHARGGYDRKAELLQYCQQLRAIARREQASPAPQTTSKAAPSKIITLRRDPSVARNPTCLGDWKRVLLPGFILRSAVNFGKKKEKRMTVKKMNESIGNTMHAVAKSLRVGKQQGFIKKLLTAFRSRK